MSDADAARKQRLVEYLAQTLQRNPLEESGLIVQQRCTLLGLNRQSLSPPADTASQHLKQRTAVLAEISEIRQEFWTLPLAPLQARLGRLDAAEFPDLALAINRLRTVAAHRSKLPTIVHDRDFYPEFFSIFKDVLVTSPRESAIFKERAVVLFAKRPTGKRGKRMVHLLQRELPEVCALESDWLHTLLNQKRSSATIFPSVANSSASGSRAHFGIPWWGLLLIPVLLRLLLLLTGN